MLHVEDMIFTGTADSRNAFLSRISTLAHSPVQYLPLESDLAFCSVEIHLNKDRSIELSQRTFYSKLNDIQANDILQRDRFILNTKKIARILKSFVGGCIWLFQTRYDILFEVCNLASNIASARKSVGDMKTFLKDAKAAYKKITEQHVPLKYYPLRMGDGSRKHQLITFCDAWYASLRESSSVESCVILYAAPYRRNGPTECSGNIATFYARKISRVCRSSAHAEGVALANAADLALYTQCVTSEIFYQQHDFSFLSQPRDFSSITPFKRPPCVSDIRDEVRSFSSLCKSPNAKASILLTQNGRDISHIQSTCNKCGQTKCVPITWCNYFLF